MPFRLTRRTRRTLNGFTGLLLFWFVGVPLLGVVGNALQPEPTAGGQGVNAPCPDSVARWLPSGGPGAVLVGAFQTDRHVITLCRAADGQVYYDGQVKGQPADARNHLLLHAVQEGQDWVADNYGYRYRVVGLQRVVVTEGGSVIYDQPLQPG